ncbi:copper uptake system-associated protein [Methylosinus sp. Ce-a6]|uniref:copper uptake system-associated protein n=1 Tax=Methylosinus sp. Ce-a6 TaxID=2172005 RepID=UPI001356CA95|nr:copper uptake system-associated protein [Methylosinus sp. Ce-a6]
MRFFSRSGSSAALFCLVVGAGADVAGGNEDEAAVKHLIKQTFDCPDSPLAVEPIVVDGDIAIADRAQGGQGGRALLRRNYGKWEISLCAGEALAASRATAERRLSPALPERMSRFDGVVAVDSAGGHTPLDPHHRPIP